MKAIHGGKTKNDKSDSYKIAMLLKGGNFPSLNEVLKPLEWHIEKTAKQHDYHTLFLLRSMSGVGQILALVILYENHDTKRFSSVQDFSSYARLIKPKKESDGKWAGKSNGKIGNSRGAPAIYLYLHRFIQQIDIE